MTEFEMKLRAAQKAVGLGKLSRRDFMSFAIASGFTAAAANAMFATAARAEPKKGGVFKVAVGHGQTTDSLDPATWSNGWRKLPHMTMRRSPSPRRRKTVNFARSRCSACCARRCSRA